MSSRSTFETEVFQRDNHTCVIPWCDDTADDAHHILERDLWDNGGYIIDNGASVCNFHHKYAESDDIPPQSFYQWLEITNPPLPDSILTTDVTKWGNKLETPDERRDVDKYQSTRHIMPLYWNESVGIANNRIEKDDTEIQSVDHLLDIPLVITEKMDGGNCILVSDAENPVRARRASGPTESMKPLYQENGLYWTQNVIGKLSPRYTVYGEWLYAQHSIHYGCDCTPKCDHTAPKLSKLTGIDDDRSYFQLFGVFDTKFNHWLSWPEVEEKANELGFPTVPVLYAESGDQATFTSEQELIQTLLEYAHSVVNKGGEGIVVRSKFPYHYGQFPNRIGKYVRENHVTSDEHWSHTEITQNII